MGQIQITTPGITKALKRYKTPRAISEAIWNGFDAKATIVEVQIDDNEMGYINELKIIDNGYGIPYQDLSQKFVPFFESEKEIDPNKNKKTSVYHGKNGVGRLTFFQFAQVANWTTCYSENGKNHEYTIEINSEQLETYKPTKPVETERNLGTTVSYKGFYDLTSHKFENEVLEYFKNEFGWFLELNKNHKLIINNQLLDYEELIGERDAIKLQIDTELFNIQFVRWNKKLREYSRYYFLNSVNKEVFKETTTLNNKGDFFYHSVYVQSSFFDRFSGNLTINNNIEGQEELFSKENKQKIYKELLKKIDQLLRDKRKPFLQEYTDKLIKTLEDEKAFPEISDNEWDKHKHTELEGLIRGLYQVEPKIFVNLNTEQKRTFVHLLDLVIDSGEKDKLLEILDAIIKLDTDERDKLADLLKTTTLSRVLHTIKLIEDRYRAVESLKQLVFNKDLNANEPKHIQKYVEKHYWLFGEKFNLVTAAEPKFEEALRRYTYLLTGDGKKLEIDHKDKNREMDIFIVRQDKKNDVIDNIVLELKNPKVKLGEKELGQVKRYYRVISDEDRFNGSNMHWTFFLVGNSFDGTDYIQGEMDNAINHGEKFLVYKNQRHKIFVMTWSEVFTAFELRHNFLYERLQLQRSNLIETRDDPNRIVSDEVKNSAEMPKEMLIK